MVQAPSIYQYLLGQGQLNTLGAQPRMAASWLKEEGEAGPPGTQMYRCTGLDLPSWSLPQVCLAALGSAALEAPELRSTPAPLAPLPTERPQELLSQKEPGQGYC